VFPFTVCENGYIEEVLKLSPFNLPNVYENTQDLKERDYLADLGVDGRKILNFISNRFI
jgi:hypothetical protein